MQRIILLLTFVVSLLIFAGARDSFSTNISNDPPRLSSKELKRADHLAYSSSIDSNDPGGFYRGGNASRPIDSVGGSDTGLYLWLDPNNAELYDDKYLGTGLYVVNKRNEAVSFDAQDSRLYLIAEVFYNNSWQAIEYMPSSWCGNSYHHIPLESQHLWKFIVPIYDGKHEVQMRYRLTVSSDRLGNKDTLYSNSIPIKFNKQQLKEKKKYNPNGLMDPYDD